MDTDFKKKIDERMKEIPPYLSKAINDSGWENSVFNVGKKYRLSISDIGEIQNNLIMVLTGLTHPEDFRLILVNEVGIEPNKVDEIISDLNSTINEKIKDSLKKSLEGNSELEDEEKPDKEDVINTSDHKVLNSAGIRLDGDEEAEAKEAISSEESDLGFIPMPGLGESSPKVVEPVTKATIPAPAVFKTNLPQPSKDAPKNYYDPYREPVE